jgi:hypothetical protein
MLSSPLFRNDDVIHIRDDIDYDDPLHMIFLFPSRMQSYYDDGDEWTVSDADMDYRGTEMVIYRAQSPNQTFPDAQLIDAGGCHLHGIVDSLTVEGDRIAQYVRCGY